MILQSDQLPFGLLRSQGLNFTVLKTIGLEAKSKVEMQNLELHPTLPEGKNEGQGSDCSKGYFWSLKYCNETMCLCINSWQAKWGKGLHPLGMYFYNSVCGARGDTTCSNFLGWLVCHSCAIMSASPYNCFHHDHQSSIIPWPRKSSH